MPISSTEVANIIQSQVGMFSATAQYAQAVSAQYGYQSMGGMGVVDPRDTQSAQNISAGNIGAGLARVPGYALGGASLMSAFGFGPRMFDPFTSAIKAGSLGKRYGGWGGAIGVGAGVLGAGMAVGSGVNWMTEQMTFGAQNRGVLNAQLAQTFPGHSTRDLGPMASQVEAMARMGAGNLREITGLMKQAAQHGSLQTTSLTEFTTSFQKLVGQVRNVATVLNQSLTDAFQTMQAVKGMGVSGQGAAGFVGTMRGIGTTINASPQEMMAVAQQSSQLGRSLGMDPGQAATGGIVNAGVLGFARKNQLIKGLDPGSSGRYTGAALRFFGTGQGRRVLGAMMTPMGTLDAGMARRIASGGVSGSDIKAAYERNISGGQAGSADMLRARSGELAGQFISEFGAQGVAPAVREMVESSGSLNPESLTRTLTGLHRRDLRAMEQLASRAPEIRARIAEEAKAGFRAGQQRLGLTQVVGRAIDQLVKPVRAQFQRIGASIAQATSEALEDVGTQLGGPGAPNQGPGAQIDNLMRRAHATNNPQLTAFLTQTLGQVPVSTPGGAGGFNQAFGAAPPPSTGMGRFARDFLPTGFQLGGMPVGTRLDELPGYGAGLRQYQPGQTSAVMGIALGGRPAAWLGDRAFGGGLAGLSKGAGRGISRLAGVSGIPWSGFGTASGLGRMATGLGWLGGKGVGMLGRAGGALGIPLLAYDAITNAGPQAARNIGASPVAGGLTGTGARMINFLGQAGLLDDDELKPSEDDPDRGMGYYTRDVGSAHGGLDQAGALSAGLTPVGGLVSIGGYSGPGRQNFLTKEGRTRALSLLENPGNFEDHARALGKSPADLRGIFARAKSVENRDGESMDEAKMRFLRRELNIDPGGEKDKTLIRAVLGTQLLDVSRAFRKTISTDPEAAHKKALSLVSGYAAKQILANMIAAGTDEAAGAFLMTRPDGAQDPVGNAPTVRMVGAYLTSKGWTGVPKTGDYEEMTEFVGDNLKRANVQKSASAIGAPVSGDRQRAALLMDLMSERGFSQQVWSAQQHELMGDMSGGGGGGAQALSEHIQSSPWWGAYASMSGFDGPNEYAKWVLANTGKFGLAAEAAAAARKGDLAYRHGIAARLRGENPRARHTARQMARAVGGDLDRYTKMLKKFGAVTDTEDPRGDVRLEFAQSLSDMSESDIAALAQQAGKGSDAEFPRQAQLIATEYGRLKRLQKRAGGRKFDAARFMRELTGKRFDRLNPGEKGYLQGTNAGGYSTRVERMLLESSGDILREHNINATEAESRSLSEKIAAGLHDPSGQGMVELRAHLSTMTGPAVPGGGEPTTSAEAVNQLLGNFKVLAEAANEAAGRLGLIGGE
jgi:hypothetical protein